MTCGWGWSLSGTRLVESVPHVNWQRGTLLCGFRCDGPITPEVVDGSIKGEIYDCWAAQHLIKYSTGNIVVMDNLNSHKVVCFKETFESVGARF